ncbi:C-type lectin mannose-binding isoform [Sinocyclocheilus rhinocerous]|uniref:C-type lectin mannose-binding isoform n=1 Tax=Sinocyclocheilus rhinocerous TaxID=307959 RepID=UPI0007B96939|nr:PREDICTED: C-type lectin mannose-binding isoform-like [Sinocyclocheilus rhinocerous]
MMKRFLFLLLLSALTHISLSQTCMFYFIPKSMDWSDAQTHCRQNYIDLATMDDQTDQDEMMRVIRQVYNGDVWIGLSRMDANASWIWSDQSPSTFMPWDSNQPNNWKGHQYCVIVTPGAKLNDLGCKSNVPSVCYTERSKQTVRLEVKSSPNVNDPAVKTEVLLQIAKILKQKRLTDYAKLLWKIQPDGNVFQKSRKSDAIQPT